MCIRDSLQADPHELHNLYSDPAFAAPQREMLEELVRLQRQYDDTLGLRMNDL